MQAPDVAALTSQVLWVAFFIAVAFGAVAQRTHFCTMGAVADVVHLGDWTRARMWAGAIGTAMVGFAALAAGGWIDPAASFYTTPRLLWLSHALGGLMFGFGMVLGSGCGSKTLVRLGGGNLKSLVVFLVLGLSAYMTLRGVTAVLRVATVDQVAWALPVGQDLPALLAGSDAALRRQWAGGLGATLGLALWAWVLARREGRSAEVLLGALGVGGAVVAMWWTSGVLGYLPEHPQTLEPAYLASNSRTLESLSFVAPVAYTLDWLMLFSDRSNLISLGVVSTAGVVAGSAVAALASRRFRWEGFANVEDLAHHLVGATLMGVGGVTAVGCTIGQGLSGVSTLSLGSFIALAAILAGAVLALRYQVWRLERLA
jgi:uncharacterized protein